MDWKPITTSQQADRTGLNTALMLEPGSAPYKRVEVFQKMKQPRVLRPSTNDYTDTGYDRGHLAQREAFKGNADAERAADHMENVVPMHPDLNRGDGSPWRAAEEDTIRLADKYGSVTVEVTPIYDANPQRLPIGTPIPKGIHRKVVAPDGQVLQDLTFINR